MFFKYYRGPGKVSTIQQYRGCLLGCNAFLTLPIVLGVLWLSWDRWEKSQCSVFLVYSSGAEIITCRIILLPVEAFFGVDDKLSSWFFWWVVFCLHWWVLLVSKLFQTSDCCDRFALVFKFLHAFARHWLFCVLWWNSKVKVLLRIFLSCLCASSCWHYISRICLSGFRILVVNQDGLNTC